jgi:hypothetical protein
MRISRHRMTLLLELSAQERTLTGPERMLREQDVARLIKAAYDEASEAARAEFMARVQPMPTSAWPWSAVQAMVPRGGGGLGSIAVQQIAAAPAALILIRGQAESADASPGDVLPARGSPEGAEWEPLHRALDSWDTATIARWIGPQGWMNPTGASPGGASGSPEGSTSGPTAGGTAPVPVDPPAPLWRSPVVVATGAVAVVATGIAVYALARSGDVKRLEDRINAAQRQEGER